MLAGWQARQLEIRASSALCMPAAAPSSVRGDPFQLYVGLCRSEFVQWTCWNTLLTMQLMLTHVGCAWTNREGRPVQHLLFCGELWSSSGQMLSFVVADGLARLPASVFLFSAADMGLWVLRTPGKSQCTIPQPRATT